MKTRIVTLVENKLGEHTGLKTEHGLSFYIEENEKKIIFDTGQSDYFIQNAQKLNIALNNIDAVALSHGHYDHSGGFRSLVKLTTSFNLFIGKGFFEKKHATDGISYEYLGNDFDEQFLSDRNINYKFVDEPMRQIVPGVFALTQFPRIHPDENINPRFVLETGQGFVPDPFSDELCLAVDTEKGFVVIVGCSHPGIKNILDAASTLLPKAIYAVIGGTHLIEASQNSIEISVQYFNESKLGAIGVSHCTGEKAAQKLEKSNHAFFRNTTGHSLVL